MIVFFGGSFWNSFLIVEFNLNCRYKWKENNKNSLYIFDLKFKIVVNLTCIFLCFVKKNFYRE